MGCSSHCLFTFVALVLIPLTYAENEWSGFVNIFQTSFDYQCPNEYAVTGVASVFDDTVNDRRWEYQCGSGGNLANVSSSCTLQNAVHILTDDITYQCPGDTYISGFYSLYSAPHEDRLWSPYCCSRNYSTLVNCHILVSNWENTLEGTLNWTATNNRVLTGITSFFSAFNRDRRWRFRQCEIQVSCGDPGVPENAVREGNSFLYQDEVVFTCNNGYYQSSGAEEGRRVCQDTGLWSETQPVCTRCTDIANCADIRCTDATDHYCFECESNHGVIIGESAYQNFNDSCEPLCSWLESFCYPGVCPGGPSTCNCSDGYTGPDCLIITDQPDLISCSITVSSLVTTCSQNATATHYINYIPTDMSVQWQTLFLPPIISPALKPVYVQSYSIGISQVQLQMTVYRQTSYPNFPASITWHSCDNTIASPDSPKSSLVNCQVSIISSDISNHTFLHGDWFKVVAYTNNGGFLNITNLDDNYTTTHYYTGTPITPFSLFVIDTHPPTHCSIVPSETCLVNQEILQESLTHNSLSVTWGGWTDDPSDIKNYRLEIYKLVYNSGTGMLEKAPSFDRVYEANNEDKPSYLLEPESSLSSEGPYSIVLIITDNAGNQQYARRIIVYDATSSLEEDAAIPLIATSGYPDGTSYWHNSTTTPITISGERHFYNTNLKTTNWLAPIANHTPQVPLEFDDNDRFGVPNALGITQLSFTYLVDQVGGNSIISMTQPSSFPGQTDDLALSNVEVPVIVNDGDSVSIWFEARDFKNNPPAYEKVLVHIDSSPPVVESLGLVKEGVSNLIFLHGTESLLDLNITFDAFDVHSGLYKLDWSLETDEGIIIAKGQIPVYNYDRPSCLIDPGCRCNTVTQCHDIHHTIALTSANFLSSTTAAKHDTDYFITVTATNYARLSFSLTRQFTVDLTPPLPGAVFEGPHPANLIDIDYTTSYAFTAEWKGFFDRETGIINYQYIVSTECASADSFLYPNTGTSPAIDTNGTSIQWTAPVAGKYHVTVVSYNGAYLPSVPVCSDGVVVDLEPPTFKGVVVPGGVVREGLVRVSDEVWFIDSDRRRSLVSTEACANESTLISLAQLFSFPIKYNGSIPYVKSIIKCSPYSDIIYTSVDYAFNITWSVTDDNGIRDYQIAIATTYNSTVNPDILPLQSTAGHSHYSVHSSLFLSGYEFYLKLKAIDLALHESTVIIGPIIIDTSPPVVNGTLITSVHDGLFIVTWDETGFYDKEDIFPLDRFEYSIGRGPYMSDVLPFTPIPSNSSLCSMPYCIVIATEMAGFLPGNQYHVTLKITNTANLATIVPLDPYAMPHPLTNCLSVFDYDSLEEDPFRNGNNFCGQSKDLDIVFNDTEISVGWSGLTEPRFNASFYVAMGTQPGWSDVVNFTYIDASESSYTFTDYELYDNVYYYTTVKASNSWNTVTVSSDGFFTLFSAEVDNLDAFIWDGWSDQYDVDYQLSSTVAAAHWYYPEEISRWTSHYEWAVFEVADGNRSNLIAVSGYTSSGHFKHGTFPVSLSPDRLYLSSVRACFKARCLFPIFSDGFRLATPPVAGNLTAAYTHSKYILYDSRLDIEWTPFQDPELHYYEWSLGSDKNGRQLMTNWTRVSPNITNVTFIFDTPLLLSPYTLYYVTLRGVNLAGLETRLSTELTIVQAIFEDIHVYDIESSYVTPLHTNDYRQLSFYAKSYTELDYTNSSDSLSAAWPDFRYKNFSYSISTTREFAPCQLDSSYSIACGSTIGNSITVSDLQLVHGTMYYFCVQGLAEDMFSPTATGPFTVTACSDGIVADLSPPTSGCVQLVPLLSAADLPVLGSEERGMAGSGTGEQGGVDPSLVNWTHSCVSRSGSQSSMSELRVVWDWFEDVEQYGNGPFAYGISNYQYAIGTSPGSQNVVKFTDVGVVREVTINGLSLTSGLVYYATIKGIDHTGQFTVATSPSIVIDTSPPVPNRVWLNTPTSISITTPNQLVANWDLVTDRESGMTSSLYWSLGSTPGLSDIYPWTKANVTDITSSIISDITVPDGQPLVLSIISMNNVGLVTVKSSRALIYDTTPPCTSRVYDGRKPDHGTLDLDYTSNYTHLSAHWDSFSDPHSGVSSYDWSLGTCKGCTDIMEYINVGLLTKSTRRYSCIQGQKYFVTVRGCSVYSGCTITQSDGIIIDATGPITSILHHGIAESTQFQSSRFTISCHWSGFHDAESGLSHFVYYAGTSPGDHTYIPPTPVPSSVTSFTTHSPFSSLDLLPLNRTVYVTLEAHNRAGAFHKVSSRGVFVSDRRPQLCDQVTFDSAWAGSLVGGTQYTNSLLRLEWNFTDLYTNVDQYFFSVWADERTYLPLPPSYGYNTLVTSATHLDLSDGSYLSALVIACNQVGLCDKTTSNVVLVDSSPPVDGHFVYKTSSIADIPWAVPDGMSWYHNSVDHSSLLNISFAGFSDPHSGVLGYWVSVGSLYGGGDLYHSASPLVVWEHPSNPLVTVATVQLSRRLAPNETVYIWLWAENGVGLESKVSQGTFDVQFDMNSTDSGYLKLLRSLHCPLESCKGHCTCGQRGHYCDVSGNITSTCSQINISDLSEDMKVTISNIASQSIDQGSNDVPIFTAAIDKLIGLVQYNTVSPAMKWIEWSVSEINQSPGYGLIDTLSQPVWFPLSPSNRPIFIVGSTYPLKQGKQYMFKVRVWYNFTHYSMFVSNDITVDSYNPIISSHYSIKEISHTTNLDIDFTSSTSVINLDWSNVFSQLLSGKYSNYKIGIGESPASDNIYRLSSIGNITSFNLTGLPLKGNRKYYSTIRVTNPLGLVATSVSDGFLVDLTPPKVGVIFNGEHLRNRVAQSNNDSLSFRILGFHDPESHLRNFEIGVAKVGDTPTQYANVYLNLKPRLEFDLEEAVYFADLRICNTADTCIHITSHSFVVDSTPPAISYFRKQGDNLCDNGSFEEDTDVPDRSVSVPGWETNGEFVYYRNTDLLKSDCLQPNITPLDLYSLRIHHKLSKTIYNLQTNITYCVSFYVLAKSDKVTTFEVECGGVKDFEVCLVSNDANCIWKLIEFFFTPTDPTVVLSITPTGDEPVILDGFSMRTCRVIDKTDSSADSFFLNGTSQSSGKQVPYVELPIFDLNSDIEKLMLASGTVPGGVQKMDYKESSGVSSNFCTEDKFVQHNTSVHFSVAATNYAGLTRKFHSTPMVIDKTPPEIRGDGLIEIASDTGSNDVDYVGYSSIMLDWSNIVDEESGIKQCLWGLGSSIGKTDLKPLNVSHSTFANISDMSLVLSHGTKVFGVVYCLNNAGYTFYSESDGITFLTQPPKHELASLNILSPILTLYRSQSGYLPSNSIQLVWNGFEDFSDAPLYYQLRIVESGSLKGPNEGWSDVGSLLQVTLHDINVTNNTQHTVQVRAFAVAGLVSEPISATFSVVPSAPVWNNNVLPIVNWQLNQLTLEWPNLFTSLSPMVYEVSLGSQMGSTSVRRWVSSTHENNNERIVINEPGLTNTRQYVLAINAIAYNGKSATANYMIDNASVVALL